MSCEDQSCPVDCVNPFEFVRAYPLQQGTSLVTWSLRRSFAETGIYSFQLQWSQYPTDDDSAWEDVGDPQQDALSATDTEKRQFGQTVRSHYRVVLTTSDGVHRSTPTPVLQHLTFKQKVLAEQTLRTELLSFERGINSARGYLLKRKTSGPVCPVCFNKKHQRCDDPRCLSCYGTGFTGGYWLASACSWVEFKNIGRRSFNDESKGTVENEVRPARMLNVPQVFSKDVWIQHNTDQRYVVASYNTAIEIGGMPYVLEPVELRQAPMTDIIYNFPIEAMVRS